MYNHVRSTKCKHQFHKFDADLDMVFRVGLGCYALYLSFFFIGLKLTQFVDVKIYIVIYFDACNFGDFIILYIYTTS